MKLDLGQEKISPVDDNFSPSKDKGYGFGHTSGGFSPEPLLASGAHLLCSAGF
jgi:hypothetical protein